MSLLLFCKTLSCEKLHNSARDFLRLEHFFKANVSTSIPVLYIKTKSTETTVIVIQWPDLLSSNSHWFIRSNSRLVSKKSDRFDPKICRATLVFLSWCDISVILQSYFDRILTGGRKCCLNVIPAGSFSLPPPPPFFPNSSANESVRRLFLVADWSESQKLRL